MRTVGNLGKGVLDFIQRSGTIVSAIFVFSIIGLMFSEVVARRGLGTTLGFTETIIKLMMGWTVFLLLGVVARRDEHIRIGFFVDKLLGPKAKSFVFAAENFLMLPLCLYLGWVGYNWVAKAYRLGYRDDLMFMGGPSYPSWVPMVILPIGLFLAALYYLERVIRAFSGKGPTGSAESMSGGTFDNMEG